MAKGGVRTRGVDAPDKSENCGSEGEKESSASQSRNSNVSRWLAGWWKQDALEQRKGFLLLEAAGMVQPAV